MATRTVMSDAVDETLKRIARFGTERVVSVSAPDENDVVTITTDRLAAPKLEIR